MKDSMGDRMKDYEQRTRYMLPRRCYTMIRLDGKAFHSLTKGLEQPFDVKFRHIMTTTARDLFKQIQGAKFGYTQSDEISLVLTDFDDIKTNAWFDGNLQKICSVSASIATAVFNAGWIEYFPKRQTLAMFDCRVWTLSDPWEVYNTFLWRQRDCMRNAVLSAARTVMSHKEMHGLSTDTLQEELFKRGINFNDYPVQFKRGVAIYPAEADWEMFDNNMPILSQDPQWFFDKIPMISRPGDESEKL